jgi:hypothetical protein
MATTIPNFSFESDFTDWTTSVSGGGTWAIRSDKAHDGTKAAWYTGVPFGSYGAVKSDLEATVYEGQFIEAQCWVSLDTPDDSQSRGRVQIEWLDNALAIVDTTEGRLIEGDTRGQWHSSYASGNAPSGATKARVVALANANEHGGVLIDEFTWNHVYDRTIALTSPVNAATYGDTATIPLAVELGGTEPPVVQVAYIFDLAGPTAPVTVGTSTEAPYSYNASPQAAGTYSVTAVATLEGGSTLTSAAVTITVSATPPPPTLREFKASNSYTYLVGQNFAGLGSSMPATALVTGVEVLVDYTLQTLTRAKDLDVEDPDGANPDVLFDITDGGTVEVVLLSKDGETYTASGGVSTEAVVIDRSDFDIVEEGTSEGKKWVVLEAGAASVTVGNDTELFGSSPIAVSDFLTRSLGLRFYPNLLAKPAYADSGDACIRFFINKLRVRVYFDAGSAEYYFASADKTQIIKGNLVHSYVEDGDFRTGDASGTLQLKEDLEVMLGTQTWIGDDWTIHAAYPPTDANQIGTVDNRATDDGVGMAYNGLPTQQTIVDNRSRYQFITANFFADKDLDSIYGAHGLPRAFAYNGDFFYKIYTQSNPVKDSPRHVAYHHDHLALGYERGAVDISVVGEPYNFQGVEGASSWSIGDKVVGLLPLSGTILGAFGSKSIWGISGTTVDNFATQVITPNIGAIEYTIADMGFPVYANAYGVYTLAQSQAYGDYLGTPMSQDVSPWLKPRLLRKGTSDREVVVAWPVRSKNQYRLAFSDGYITSMTLNGGQQAAPTFSFQKYTIYDESDV